MKKSTILLLSGYGAAIIMITVSLAYIRWGILPSLMQTF